MSFLLLGPTSIFIPDETNWKMALIFQLREANENWNYTEPLWNRYSVKVSVPSCFIGITSPYTDVFQSTESFPHRFLEVARVSRRSQLPMSMVSIEAGKWTGPKSRIRYRRISVGKGRLHTVEIRQARTNCSAFVRSSEIFEGAQPVWRNANVDRFNWLKLHRRLDESILLPTRLFRG